MAPRILILLSALGVTACGDAILCDSTPLVVIQSPSETVTVDGDSAAAGVQTDVRVRSSLLASDGIELIVLDETGAEVMTYRQPAGSGGSTVFAGVTIPGTRARLQAIGRSTCGYAEDEVEVEVVAGSGCDLQLTPVPQPMGGHVVGVLNAAADPDPGTPGFQAEVAVTTRGGWTVELFANAGQGEQSIGQGMADAMGIARFPQALGDGPVSFRAVCRGGGDVVPSPTTSALVDTTPPTCDFAHPLPGSSITPSHDEDGDLGNGVQLTLEALIGGGDASGEPVQLTVTSTTGSTMVPMTPVDGQGRSTAMVTLDPPSAPVTFLLALAARDRAGNPCTIERPYDVVYDGCSIEVIAPTAPVTVDADGVAANGSQVEIQLAVDPLCVGRVVTSTCGANSPGDVVPPTGPLTLRADICGTSPCETQAMCTFQVSSPAGVQTQTSALIEFDDRGPAVVVEVVDPPLACGAQITPAADVDPVAAGVQLTARVTAAGAMGHVLELTSTGGTTSTPAPGDVTITVDPGLNLLTGAAFDALGNRGQSLTCTIALADMAVAVAPPATSGLLGRNDGTVAGSSLTFQLCGTVDRLGAAVAVRVDDGPPLPAVVAGQDFCRTLTLHEGQHAVVITATKGTSFGNAAIPLRVDLTPPDAVTAFTGTVPTRRKIGLSWTAPADGGAPVARYVAKVSTTPLTDESFDTEGTVIATGTPRAPGSAEAVEHPGRMGTPYWLGVASVDPAGNRAPAAIVGPITPALDRLGPVGAPNAQLGNLSLGAAIAHGRFNDDELDDVAIAAPTQDAAGLPQAGAVYVYLGTPSGISTTPSLTLLGAAGSLTGAGLAAVQWSSAGRDDLVIGAPGADGGAGRVFVFAGGAGFPSGVATAASAALQVRASTTAPGWFANGNLGATVVAADVDGDGVRDLVASAPRGGGTGGIVILYGGTVTSSVALSSTDTSGFGSAIVEYLPDPLAQPGRGFGTYLHAVGPTRGPLDADDDLVVAYEDDVDSSGESLYVIRGNGTRPTAPLTLRAFVTGRDVRVDLVTVYKITEFGAQAVTIADHNGDGASDLAISAYRNLNGAGQVLVIDGDAIGNSGVATTTQPGVVLTTIQGASGTRLGAVIVADDGRSDIDLDGDEQGDLLIGALSGNIGHLYVWYGGTLPSGTTSVATAGAVIPGPAVFAFNSARPHGPSSQGRWVGDLNGDGLDDVCWASPYDNATSLDGAFVILSDGLP